MYLGNFNKFEDIIAIENIKNATNPPQTFQSFLSFLGRSLYFLKPLLVWSLPIFVVQKAEVEFARSQTLPSFLVYLHCMFWPKPAKHNNFPYPL